MEGCNISFEAPKKFLKGAGISNTAFLPAWIYKVKIVLKNHKASSSICSLSATLGNGIRYMNNLHIEGPDKDLQKKIIIEEPNISTGNNNVIIFANNFSLSPNSDNEICFDTCLYDRYTINSKENSGDKIPHKSNIQFFGHLIDGEHANSCSFTSTSCDYDVSVECEDKSIPLDGFTKFYIQCMAGQYDMVRGLYVRSILDQGIEFIADSSNLEPRNVYSFDKRTILKWDLETLQPSEVKKIGYIVTLKSDNPEKPAIKSGDILKNKINSNCINNSTYAQCPANCVYELTVK